MTSREEVCETPRDEAVGVPRHSVCSFDYAGDFPIGDAGNVVDNKCGHGLPVEHQSETEIQANTWGRLSSRKQIFGGVAVNSCSMAASICVLDARPEEHSVLISLRAAAPHAFAGNQTDGWTICAKVLSFLLLRH